MRSVKIREPIPGADCRQIPRKDCYTMQMTMFNRLAVAMASPDPSVFLESDGSEIVRSCQTEISRWMDQIATAGEIKRSEYQPGYVSPTLTLSSYQTRALLFVEALDRAFLFMEQGTGKTPVMIAAAVRRGCSTLVVCPKAVRNEWASMISEFFPEQRFEIIRDSHVFTPRSDTIYICGYERLRRLPDMQFDMIILDECHRLKNPTGATNSAVYRLQERARYVYGLTGTPYGSDLTDVFGIFKVVDNRFFGAYKGAFMDRYVITDTHKGSDGHEYQRITGYRDVEEIQRKIACISYRVLKRDCLDLTEPTETRLWAERPDEYTTFKRDYVLETDNGVASIKSILNLTGKLQQICSGFISTEDGQWSRLPRCDKLSVLMDYILENDGDQMIVYVTYDMSETMISERLRDNRIEFRVISGHVSDRDRDTAKRDFSSGKARILILKYGSGTEGLNLQNCHIMIFYDLTCSYIQYDQAKSRIHRRGQESDCVYVHMITEHSVEEKIYRALQRRKDFARYLLEDRDI